MKHILTSIALAGCIVLAGCVTAGAQERPHHTGVYAGLLMGASTGLADASGSILATSVDVSGIELSGVIGAATRLGASPLIVGVEADLTWKNVTGSETALGIAALQTQQDWAGSLRARIGVPFDRFLIYLTGGVAFGANDTSLSAFGTTLSNDETLWGWVLGGGVEYAINQHVALRAEVLRTELADAKLSLATLGGPLVKLESVSTAFRLGAVVSLW